MTDREKAIKGLECCIDETKCGVECPYWNDNGNCRSDMESDALALLKDQAAAEGPRRDAMNGVRVMTADDMATCLTGDVILLEDRATGSVINAIMCQKLSHADDDTIYTEAIEVVTAYTVGSAWLGCDKYNRTWRCWTSRPTDAQREATPWKT